jgi:hypothetical protein
MHWQGELLHIHIATKASAPMDALSEARLVPGVGLEGDRYATRLGTYSKKHHIDRQATLAPAFPGSCLASDTAYDLELWFISPVLEPTQTCQTHVLGGVPFQSGRRVR